MWPVSGAPIGCPVSASHTRTVSSALPETMRLPVRAERHTEHQAGVAGQRRADRLPGGRVPHPHRLVAAAGDDPLAVGAERHARSPCRCGRSAAADRLAGVGVPHPHRPVVAAGDDAVPVRAERHTATPRRCGRSAAAPIGWPVAASHTRTVLSALPETMRCPSGLNATLITAPVWPVSGCADRLAGGRVPHPHGVVAAAGDDALARRG